jgi:hypothetical protein
MRLFGRVAFPLFAFLLVQGFLYTRDWKRYALRLAVFAAVSEIPYDLVAGQSLFYPEEQNTILLLLIGLLTLKAAEEAGKRLGTAGFLAAALAGAFAAWITRADYGPLGLLFILALYRFHGYPMERMAAGGALLFLIYGDFYAIAAWLSFFFINRYTGEKGKPMGITAYLFYPVHLLSLYFAGVFIHGYYF